MSRHIIAAVEFGDGAWAARLARPEPGQILAAVGCDSCGASLTRPCPPEAAEAQIEALLDAALFRGWRLDVASVPSLGARDYCDECVADLGPGPGRDGERPTFLDARCRAIPRGFTLVELMVVLVVVSIIAAITLAAVGEASGRRATLAAAQLLQGEHVAALARSQLHGVAGWRLEPDPAYPVARLADGSVDPSRPLAFSRLVQLVRAPGIASGRVSIHDTFPAGFTPPPRVLVLEQVVKRLESGVRLPIEPTAWDWRVRLGDRLELAGRGYTVCGPVFRANPEGFVNYPRDAAGRVVTGLDRGDGDAEWLMLVNGLDDDRDGTVDNGWNGRDDDFDGVVDNAAEWSETEEWGLSAAVLDAPYSIFPRPVAAPGVGGLDLAGALVDATGWDDVAPPRSRLPVDRFSGCVDLVVHPDGRVSPSSRYAPTAPLAFGHGRPFVHLWICDRGSIDVAEPDSGRLVSISARTGRAAISDADPARPAEAVRLAEGGGH